MKRVIVPVINDLSTDQRVARTCSALHEMGFDVLLVGRQKSDSKPLIPRPYRMHRMKLLFEKGALFYAEYNIRLFLLLIFNRVDLIFSNDLDTLLASYLASKIKTVPVIYDSHEIFTETPEVIHRPFVRNTWLMIEKNILPKLDTIITVNESIARFYKDRYGKEVKVIRNVPFKRQYEIRKSKKDLGLPEDKYIILLQGAGINIHRGAEEATEAMQHIDDAILLIIGGGDVFHSLRKIVRDKHLEKKVIFRDKMPFDELFNYTVLADIGLTIDKDTNINYKFSLPNKLFDYIQAQVPVLASPLPEISRIITKYNIGTFIDDHEPEHIARKISSLLKDREQIKIWKENLKFVSEELIWENEKQILVDILRAYAG